MVTGTPPVTGTHRVEGHGSNAQEFSELSVLGEDFDHTPMVIPIRAHLDSVKRLLKGDVHIGRGSRQRDLPKSRYCNNYKVSEVGPDAAIAGFRDAFLQDKILYASLWTLSGTRLVCLCRANENCHGDVLIEEFRSSFPTAHDRTNQLGPPPDARILDYVARLREEPESDDGSGPDEGVPDKHAGHRGIGKPMQVGVGYVQRDLCDGQSLASPGRWAPASRVYPTTARWRCVADTFQRFTDFYGTQDLLVTLAIGNVDKCPFLPDEVANLKEELVGNAAAYGLLIWEGVLAIGLTFRLITVFFTCFSNWPETQKLVSVITRRASELVREQGCQGFSQQDPLDYL